MKIKRYFVRFILILALAISLFTGWKTLIQVSEAQIAESVPSLDQKKVLLLMRYHGTLVARKMNGKWYFLDRRGRWLPMETHEACRFLAQSFHRPNDSCL
ncbi:binding-protein-dependent transport systems inner membrane component [Thermodesulfatator indicus DSM 15286]|uniref:Binding-protein-dependent transport systems inner membrane component n=1 Tax=Thermodesulfatator indicus (strain DSM 15286 / JCM 11887 / CIR29812) TaxID=667014 RepID=F8AD82_THEID|nr:hypothetical protein [Thermodesulfatator indicus]AEH44814.1 binding-protein-dependent transport systems inner membrane component [Thermodesulfatator indicus DSM 15286]